MNVSARPPSKRKSKVKTGSKRDSKYEFPNYQCVTCGSKDPNHDPLYCEKPEPKIQPISKFLAWVLIISALAIIGLAIAYFLT